MSNPIFLGYEDNFVLPVSFHGEAEYTMLPRVTWESIKSLAAIAIEYESSPYAHTHRRKLISAVGALLPAKMAWSAETAVDYVLSISKTPEGRLVNYTLPVKKFAVIEFPDDRPDQMVPVSEWEIIRSLGAAANEAGRDEAFTARLVAAVQEILPEELRPIADDLMTAAMGPEAYD